MTPINILLANQMHLFSLIHKADTLLDPDTLEIYVLKGEWLTSTLFPETHEPITHIQEKNLLSISEVLSSEISGNQQEISGQLADTQRNLVQTPIRPSAESNQTISGEASEYLQKLNRYLAELSNEQNFVIPKLTKTELLRIEKIKGYNFSPFSGKYKDKVQELSQEIEAYTYSALFTSKASTLKKIEKSFEMARKWAHKGSISELRAIKDETRTRRKNQINNAKSNNTVNKKTNAKRIRLTVLLSVFVIIATLVVAKTIIDGITSNPNPNQIETKIYSTDEIIELITVFCSQKDTALTQWRVGYIIDNFTFVEISEEEAFNEINNLAKYK